MGGISQRSTRPLAHGTPISQIDSASTLNVLFYDERGVGSRRLVTPHFFVAHAALGFTTPGELWILSLLLASAAKFRFSLRFKSGRFSLFHTTPMFFLKESVILTSYNALANLYLWFLLAHSHASCDLPGEKGT